MALNIIKELKLRKTRNKVLEAQLEECKKELDEKKKHLHRAVRRMSYLEDELHKAHEENLTLKGELKRQERVMDFVLKQNTDVILASAKPVPLPTIRVMEVRVDGKAENSNSGA